MATGCGQSKKKAKHSAAKSILDKLIGAQNSGKAPAGQPTIPDLATEVLSPYDDGIQGNPVGLLQELCMSRRWPPPTYDLSHEEGLPHERSFTIKCIIEGKHIEVGAGKSKKLAKRQAANKMIQRLRDAPVENEDAFQHIDDDMLAQGLAHVKEASLKAGSSHSQQVSRFHKNLKGAQVYIVRKLEHLKTIPLSSIRVKLWNVFLLSPYLRPPPPLLHLLVGWRCSKRSQRSRNLKSPTLTLRKSQNRVACNAWYRK